MHFKAKRVEQFNCGACGCSITSPEAKPLSTLNCPQCGVAVRVPVSFDRYLLTQATKKDSTGTTFRAIDTHLSRTVSVKVLRGGDPEADRLARAAIETARALAPLDHPNVIRILTVGFFLDQHYIVTELAAGGSLQDRIAADHQMDEKEALRIAMGVARGLQAALDEARLIHMNVKPSNVQLGRHGEPKLIEFSTTNCDPEGRQRGVVGTPNYIAPEVVRGQAPAACSDIYSFGVTVFYLLAGHLPFMGEDVMKQRLQQPAPSVAEFRKDLSIAAVALVDRCLETEPENRFAAYPELIEAIEEAMKGESAAVPAPVEKPAPAAAVIAPPVEEEEAAAEEEALGESAEEPTGDEAEEDPVSVPLSGVSGSKSKAAQENADADSEDPMEAIIRQMEMASWSDLDAQEEAASSDGDAEEGSQAPVHGSVEEAQENVSALMGGLLDAVDDAGVPTVDAAIMSFDPAGSILGDEELDFEDDDEEEPEEEKLSQASGLHPAEEAEQEVHALDAVIARALEDEAPAPKPTDALIHEAREVEKEEAADAAQPLVGQDLIHAASQTQAAVDLADALGTIGDIEDQVVDEDSIAQIDMALAGREKKAPALPAGNKKKSEDDWDDEDEDVLDSVMDELGLPDAPKVRRTEDHPLAPSAGDDYLDDLADGLSAAVSPTLEMPEEDEPEPASLPPAPAQASVAKPPVAAEPLPSPAVPVAPATAAEGVVPAAGLSSDRMAKLKKTKIARPVEEAPQPTGLSAGIPSAESGDASSPAPAGSPQTGARLGMADGLTGDKMSKLKKLKLSQPVEEPVAAAPEAAEPTASGEESDEGALGLVSGLSTDKMARLKRMKLNTVTEEELQPKEEEVERPAASMNADKLAKLKKMRLK